MILVDSSVWVDYFNGVACPETDRLDRLLAIGPVLTGDIILTEVLQGFDNDAEFRRARTLLARLPFEPMLGRAVALQSAANYRRLRRQGVTVRKTIDVMIATFCIINNHTLLHRDRDFDAMERALGLKVLR
ncbi:MAG: PIN domain nuclease [Betaproteobacteria bacterium]|nr:PIN domain nuclease [Betaproteobacteria bacterium]